MPDVAYEQPISYPSLLQHCLAYKKQNFQFKPNLVLNFKNDKNLSKKNLKMKFQNLTLKTNCLIGKSQSEIGNQTKNWFSNFAWYQNKENNHNYAIIFPLWSWKCENSQENCFDYFLFDCIIYSFDFSLLLLWSILFIWTFTSSGLSETCWWINKTWDPFVMLGKVDEGKSKSEAKKKLLRWKLSDRKRNDSHWKKLLICVSIRSRLFPVSGNIILVRRKTEKNARSWRSFAAC